MCIYFEGGWAGREWAGEGKRENPKKAPCCQCRAPHGAGSKNHEIMTWAEIKSQTLDQLSHPSTPDDVFFKYLIFSHLDAKQFGKLSPLWRKLFFLFPWGHQQLPTIHSLNRQILQKRWQRHTQKHFSLKKAAEQLTSFNDSSIITLIDYEKKGDKRKGKDNLSLSLSLPLFLQAEQFLNRIL